MSKKIIALAVLLLTLGSPFPAKAGAGEDTIRGHVKSARALFPNGADKMSAREAGQLKEKLLTVSSKFIDSDFLVQSIFKDSWDTMTDSQKAKTLDVMGRLVKTNYSIALYQERGSSADYRERETADSQRVVLSTIKGERAGKQFSFTRQYRLHVFSDSWRCFDYSNDGVELLANYKSQIDALIKKRGVDSVLEKIDALAAKTESRLLSLFQGSAD